MPDLAQPLADQRRWFTHLREAGPGADVAIGVAASFTAQPLEPFVGVPLLEAGVVPSFRFAEYNQIHQVCYDPTGALGKIDVLIVLWRIDPRYGTLAFAVPLSRLVQGQFDLFWTSVQTSIPFVIAGICLGALALSQQVATKESGASEVLSSGRLPSRAGSGFRAVGPPR